MEKTLVEINNNEIDFLNEKKQPFDSGIEFTNTKHAYSYDLDIFGNNSLFQHLNRTATYIGKLTLANRLIHSLPQKDIVPNQEAINELTNKIKWRQFIYAIAKNLKDSSKKYNGLLQWAEKDEKPISKSKLFLAYFIPVLLIASIILQFFVQIDNLHRVSVFLFISNLIFTSTHTKQIKAVLIDSDNIDELLKKYSLILIEIENHSFKNKKLQQLQSLLNNQKKASVEIKKLSVLFGNTASFLNIFGAVLFNGFFQYHVHNLNKLIIWKKNNASKIKTWLQVMGEFETLNSLANFSYNNPAFCYPKLNFENTFKFTEIGHPLIPSKKRVTNSINFKKHPFIILTGSNMSGKSTFLRTIGVNLVLAKSGAVICAKQATIHPLDLLVFMRLDDSLSENESYFFAEIKRLQLIAEASQQKSCFILLDEILKGTNSDDKRNGTIAFIKKMIAHQTTGIIATHDLEVCHLTNQFPNYLTNMHFEVNINQNELHFDYKLRYGTCVNQSASFLMEKLKII